jgi:thioredoxin-dependent peroxiredoxin
VKECDTPRSMTSRLWLAVFGMVFITAVQGAPTIGQLAPGFALNTLAGESVKLDALTSQSRVVLIVLRGFPGYQCPLCTRQVNEFVARAKDFSAKGVRVVMVYPGPATQLQARAKEFLASKDWPAEFVFLLDPDYTFTNAYELRWDVPKETAYPSTFIIERDGKVTFSKTSKSHGGRTTAAEVLGKL